MTELQRVYYSAENKLVGCALAHMGGGGAQPEKGES